MLPGSTFPCAAELRLWLLQWRAAGTTWPDSSPSRSSSPCCGKQLPRPGRQTAPWNRLRPGRYPLPVPWIQTPTNALGYLFYGAAAAAYSKAGTEDSSRWDDLAREELEQALEELRAASVPDEPNPAKINWNC